VNNATPEQPAPGGNMRRIVANVSLLLLLSVAGLFLSTLLGISREHEHARMTVERAAVQCGADVDKALARAEDYHQANPQLLFKTAYEIYADALRTTCKL